MHTYGIRLLMVFMAILAIFLTAAAISLHQMYPMRATGTLSAEEQRWVNEEENRRQGELIRDEIGLLAAAGLDVAAMIVLFSHDTRRRLNLRTD